MKRLAQKLNDWWFSDAPAARLAVLRVLVGVFAVWYVADRPHLFATPGDTAHFAPVGLAWYLPRPLLRFDMQLLFGLTCITGTLFILGWKHRYVGPAFALSLLMTMCYRNSWGMVYHSMNLLILHVVILGLSRSADAWSLDALLSARREPCQGQAKSASDASHGHWRYGWPVRLMCLATMLTYCVSGVAKLAGPLGWSWVWGEALRSQIAVNALRKELLAGESSPLASALYDHVWLFTLAGVGCLILELGAPAFLWKKRLSQFWAISMFALHVGILCIMDIKFRYHLSAVAFASFFAVEYPLARLLSIRRHAAERLRNRRNRSLAT